MAKDGGRRSLSRSDTAEAARQAACKCGSLVSKTVRELGMARSRPPDSPRGRGLLHRCLTRAKSRLESIWVRAGLRQREPYEAILTVGGVLTILSLETCDSTQQHGAVGTAHRGRHSRSGIINKSRSLHGIDQATAQRWKCDRNCGLSACVSARRDQAIRRFPTPSWRWPTRSASSTGDAGPDAGPGKL